MQAVAIHRDAIGVAKQTEPSRLERARARRRHRDQLERAPHRLERIGLGVRRELRGEAEEQLRRAAAGRNQPDADLHEPHVQLGVRLTRDPSASENSQPPPSVRPNGAATTGNGDCRIRCATCPEIRARPPRAASSRSPRIS